LDDAPDDFVIRLEVAVSQDVTKAVEEISPDEARSELLPVLGSSTFVNTLLKAWAAAIGQPAFVTSTCADVTGAPARTFLEWATDHAAEFRA
jgi:hypothetical protein